MKPEVIRYAVNRVKTLSKLRIPEYEFPSDSHIEKAVWDILLMMEKECVEKNECPVCGAERHSDE